MKIAIIVQARMRSTRLPGKVLKEVLEKPLLGYLLERLARVQLADVVIVATTNEASDDCVAEYCKELGVECFRGSTSDVLDRYLSAIDFYGVDLVIRVTGDCPLIDPVLIDDMIQRFLSSDGSIDYVSNCQKRTFPRGMDIELVTAKALRVADSLIDIAIDREHVTNFINRRSELFNRLSVVQDVDQSQYRLTVDTQEDFSLIKEILERIYPVVPNFSLKDIVALLEQEKSLAILNASIQQKSDHI